MAKKITEELVAKVEAQVKERIAGMDVEAIKAEVKKLAKARTQLAKIQKAHLDLYHKRAAVRREFNVAIKTMQAALKDQRVEGVDEEEVLGFVDKATTEQVMKLMEKIRSKMQ